MVEPVLDVRAAKDVFFEVVALEPFVHTGAFDDEAGVVPLAGRAHDLVRMRRDEIVERGDGPVAVGAHRGVRVLFIIEELIFEPDGRAGGSVAFGDEIFDAAVGALGEHEIQAQLEGAVFVHCDDVAAVGCFAAAGGCHDQFAVFDGPAFFREGLFACTSPAVGGLPVEEQLPALGLFLR